MNYERFGICATVIILVGILGFTSVATSGIDVGISIPSFDTEPQHTSIDDIKANNVAERIKALQDYCEQLNIEC